jgi:hypothetical protein
MRPTALEMLRGVRTLLLSEVLPGVAAPHLRAQVSLAITMLDAAARELDDAPAAYAAERERMRTLAAEALPLVRLAAVDGPVVAELEALAVPGGGGVLKLSAMAEESARLLGVLDRLSALCDEDTTDTLASLGARVDAELRARVARRATWGGGPGG